MLTLILGGARSGKSRLALQRAEAIAQPVCFIATAQAQDAEMADRIARHQAERPAHWVTVEAPLDLAGVMHTAPSGVVVVDCLTLWVSNLMLAETVSLEAESRKLVETCSQAQTKVILVTNEVGCGIVPDNALARRFRDEAGRLHQLAAQHATEVHWMMFGIGMRIK